MPSTYCVDNADTTSAARSDRLEQWNEQISAYHCALDSRFPKPDDFRATATRQHTSSYQLVDWSIRTPQWLRRSDRHIRRDPDPRYRLLVTTGDWLVFRNAEGENTFTAGTGALFTMDSAFEIGLGPRHRGMILTVPRHEIDHRLNRSDAITAAIDLTHGLGRLVRVCMEMLTAERHALSAAEFDQAVGHVADDVCQFLLGDTTPPHGRTHEIEAQIRDYVRAHAHNPDLNTHSIARALGWSERQIQAVLHDVGSTPSALIRTERLERARQLLESPTTAHKTVTEIAHECGFGSAHTFTNGFRRRFGHTPREHRGR